MRALRKPRSVASANAQVSTPEVPQKAKQRALPEALSRRFEEALAKRALKGRQPVAAPGPPLPVGPSASRTPPPSPPHARAVSRTPSPERLHTLNPTAPIFERPARVLSPLTPRIVGGLAATLVDVGVPGLDAGWEPPPVDVFVRADVPPAVLRQTTAPPAAAHMGGRSQLPRPADCQNTPTGPAPHGAGRYDTASFRPAPRKALAESGELEPSAGSAAGALYRVTSRFTFLNLEINLDEARAKRSRST